jgi:hypothetical protein
MGTSSKLIEIGRGPFFEVVTEEEGVGAVEAEVDNEVGNSKIIVSPNKKILPNNNQQQLTILG